MNEKIFITISACNEKDLKQTVLSAINNAQDPDRLSFGILEHSMNGLYSDLNGISNNIMHIKLSYDGPLGVGIPRLTASMLNDRKQDFYLQIDAHMIFEKNWDVDIIKYYSLISQKHDKAVISTYVPWWYEDAEGLIKNPYNKELFIDPNNFNNYPKVESLALKIDSYEKNLFRRHIPIEGIGVDWNNKDYQEHFLTSGHFLFSSFNFLSDVMPDPLITWGGEEPITGLRAWTRGYQIFTIPKNIVWHKNKLGDIKDKNDWRNRKNSLNERLYNICVNNMDISYRRIKDIFLGDYVGYWGSPSLDKLKEYEYTLNVDFSEYYKLLKESLVQNGNNHLLEIMYE
jgi:hypothetical protein